MRWGVGHRVYRRAALAGAAVAIVAAAAVAMPIPVTDAPLGRVVSNLEAKLKENPGDAEVHYQLGRAHALAYATKKSTIRGFQNAGGFEPLPPACRDYDAGKSKGEALKAEELPGHLRESVSHLVSAIRLKREARYYLALASVLETAGEARLELDPMVVVVPNPYGPGVDIPERPEGSRDDPYVLSLPQTRAEEVTRARAIQGTLDPAWYRGATDERTLQTLVRRKDDPDPEARRVVRGILSDFWFEQTVDVYFIAHTLSLADEAKGDERPMGSLGLRISVESGEGFLRVSGMRPDRKGDRARTEIVRTAVKELSKQEQNGGITPIVFSLQGECRLEELVDRHARVAFDLDGTGLPQSWQWVRPDTGILVWDPGQTGRITSGRQLFGSVTWWVLFRNGYEALGALDDDRNGELSGSELDGLAVWFDRNANGRSEPGEVVPVPRLGIVGIAATATSEDGNAPCNHAGLRMSDGRELPTFDWIAQRRGAEAPLVAGAWKGAGD